MTSVAFSRVRAAMPRVRLGAKSFGVLAAVLGMIGILCIGVQYASAATGGIKEGGSMTVLEVGGSQGSWPTGIDPPNDTSPGINQDMMDSVYGEMFQLGPTGKAVPDLATGYKILNNGLTYEFNIRHGVKFSDGTPFNAAAVAFNWNRDFADKTSHNPFWPVKSITASGQYKVIVNLTAPYSPLINSIFDTPQDWIVSPTSLQQMGETKFSLTPVGAGPFKIVSDIQNVQLSLVKNPLYWQKGRPYLDKLTFKSVQSDNTALEDMQAGQGQAYIDMTTLQLVPAFKKAGLQTLLQPSTTPNDIQINTTKPPFNNILAREALYYATDVAALDKSLNGDTTKPVEGFTTPTGLFYNPTVPGYRTYNLAKAKAIVKQLGGLSFTLMISSAPGGVLLGDDLQTMYTDAGMKVTLNPLQLAPIIAAYASGNWQATTQNSGSWDPATGVGQNVRFLSGARFSGVDDKHLDQLLMEATQVPENQRAAIYQKAAIYESQQAYAVEMYPASLWDISAKNVSAPGLTTQHPQVIGAPEVWWQDAGFTTSA